jgi:hypothetical protein
MSLERLRRLLEAYGAAPARWPVAEREAALALLAASPEAQAAAAEAVRLDVVLDRAPEPAPSAALFGRVLAGRARGGGWLAWLLDGTPAWQPATALVLAAVLGLGLGGAGGLASPEDEVVVVDVAAVSLNLDLDEGDSQP